MGLNSQYPEGMESLPASSLRLDEGITKSGWLLKKSGRDKLTRTQRGQYDNRFFIIYNGWVYYYKEENSEKPQGKFSLEDFSKTVPAAAEEQSLSLPFVFKVYPKSKNGRTWYFATNDAKEMEEWREAFRQEIERFNLKPATSNLKGSFSVPEKKRQQHFLGSNELQQERSLSMSKATPHRIVSKNSMSSSKSSESRDSLTSYPSEDQLRTHDDLSLQGSNVGLYEPIETDEYRDHWIEDDFPGNDTVPNPRVPQYPKFELPRPPPVLPAKPHPQKVIRDDNFYDVIDESKIISNVVGDFPPAKAPPMPPPTASKPKPPPTPEKLLLHRQNSIPSSDPPEPPANQYPIEESEMYVDPDAPRSRFSTLQDKPLPPLPFGTEQDEHEILQYSDIAAEDNSVLYTETEEDRRWATLPGSSARRSTFLDEMGYYDDTSNSSIHQQRFHSVACVEDEACISKSPQSAAKIHKVLPMPPNAALKPKSPNHLPLKPNALKKIEKTSHSTPTNDQKLPQPPPTALKPKSPSKPFTNSGTSDKTANAVVTSPVASKPQNQMSPKRTPPSNFAKAIGSQGIATHLRPIEKPLPPVGSKTTPSDSSNVLAKWKQSPANSIDEPIVRSGQNADKAKFSPIKTPKVFPGLKTNAFGDYNENETQTSNKPFVPVKPKPMNKVPGGAASNIVSKFEPPPKPTSTANSTDVKPKPNWASNNLVKPDLKPTSNFANLKPVSASSPGGSKFGPSVGAPKLSPAKKLPPQTSSSDLTKKFAGNIGPSKPTPQKKPQSQTSTGELAQKFAGNTGVTKPSISKKPQIQNSADELAKKFASMAASKEEPKSPQSNTSETDLGGASSRAKMFGGNVNSASSQGKPPPVSRKPLPKR